MVLFGKGFIMGFLNQLLTRKKKTIYSYEFTMIEDLPSAKVMADEFAHMFSSTNFISWGADYLNWSAKDSLGAKGTDMIKFNFAGKSSSYTIDSYNISTCYSWEIDKDNKLILSVESNDETIIAQYVCENQLVFVANITLI